MFKSSFYALLPTFSVFSRKRDHRIDGGPSPYGNRSIYVMPGA